MMINLRLGPASTAAGKTQNSSASSTIRDGTAGDFSGRDDGLE
jgi:hypothetical protein